jgi:hypothetical protein
MGGQKVLRAIDLDFVEMLPRSLRSVPQTTRHSGWDDNVCGVCVPERMTILGNGEGSGAPGNARPRRRPPQGMLDQAAAEVV